MPSELGGGVFVQFPLGHIAGRAAPLEPFVAQPPGCPAVARIVDDKSLVAMGGDPGLIAKDMDRPDAVQQSFARWPDFNFFDQPKKIYPFAVISSAGRLGW